MKAKIYNSFIDVWATVPPLEGEMIEQSFEMFEG